MTTPQIGVDAGPDGLWLPLTELASMRGVSKQAIAKRVSRLENLGALEVRPGPRGSRLVNVAAFDKAAGEHVDAVRALNGAGGEDQEPAASSGYVPGPGDPVLAREQARRAAYAADLAKIELEERLGKLIPTADVEQAMVRCAGALVRAIEQLPGRADDIAAEAMRAGVAGTRTILKAVVRDLRATLEREMKLLAEAGDTE